MANKMNRNLMYGVAALVVIVVVLGVLYYNGSLSSYSNPYSTSSSSVASSSSSVSSSTSSAAYSVGTSSSSTLGNYLVDANGMTLYHFTKDTAGNSSVSACTGSCLNVWPVFYASSVSVKTGLNASDFTTFTRPDGAMQTVYKGMPLYYYASDTKAGDTMGQGIASSWYVVAP